MLTCVENETETETVKAIVHTAYYTDCWYVCISVYVRVSVYPIDTDVKVKLINDLFVVIETIQKRLVR